MPRERLDERFGELGESKGEEREVRVPGVLEV